MSSVKIKRGQFVINGKRRPYLTMTSFCLMGLYQNKRRADAQRWLDRLQRMGIDGPRLFGETWPLSPDNEFFGNPKWTPEARIIDDNQPPTSALRLLPRYERYVELLTRDLEDRGMIAEFCVVATKKDWPGTGHILNRAAQMFHQMFGEGDCPYIFETINEADAYVYPELTPGEVAAMGYRWHRIGGLNEPDHTNFPGSLIGVSAGGDWTPKWDDSGYTHRNLHPPRGKHWMMGPTGKPIAQELDALKRAAGNRPLAFNETCHYIDQKEWKDMMTLSHSKWAALSTSDWRGLIEYQEAVTAAGVSFCYHTRVGMSTDPSEPLTKLEEALASRAGVSPEPPLPPPEPPDVTGDSPSGFWAAVWSILKRLF